MLLQTHMTFFHSWRMFVMLVSVKWIVTKKDKKKNIIFVSLGTCALYSKSSEVIQKLVWGTSWSLSLKLWSLFIFIIWKEQLWYSALYKSFIVWEVMHVSNGIKVSKWWQSFYSWVNFCFKHIVMQFQPKHILNMTTRLLCDTCRNTLIQTSQKALISCRRHALHNARDPKEHKPHTKMVKQTRALTQTLTLRKLLGHFMSTLPRLHAYDTPCRDMFPESFKNEC